MRQRLFWILVVVALSCVVGWSNHTQSFSRTSWEYKVISTYGPSVTNPPPTMTALNNAGEEGWELVEIRSGDFPKAGSNQVRTDYFLKRLK